MLISKVADEDGGKGEGCHLPGDSDSQEYQTANELLDLMAKNQNYNTDDGDTLTARDLILLYKNVDLGSKLMNDANEFQCQKSNQHVETVIYNDDQDTDGSDICDIYSNEDLHNVFLINEERLDLFNNQSSAENTLCHKFGDLEIQGSINGGYDKNYLFNDPFIKNQLKSFNLMSTSHQIDGTLLPASLLDYVCCKNFEENYTFYMDNIIRYVKNTIEHLKRISNGDYLTDKVKEKWRDAENIDHAPLNDTKILATSTSTPLHFECKIDGRLTNWDDMVHSAVDIRSLSKNLERKIVIDIPKVINGSYKLLSKCCRDNLIISCKKDTKAVEKAKESRVNVMFQLKSSQIGQVISDINSIIILQNVSIEQYEPLSITYNVKETNELNNSEEKGVIITEITSTKHDETCNSKTSSDKLDLGETDFDSNKSDSLNEDNYCETFENYQDNLYEYNCLSNSNDEGNQITNRKTFDICPDYFQMTMHSMSMQSILPEETIEDVPQLMPPRKKSPKVRIKSPYENKSFAIEEKKRKKLLEIRERRERKKLELAENRKINKHKYGKVSIMPQPSNSVTKLSITNKSFYDSIYGHNSEATQFKIRNRNIGGGKNDFIEVPLENLKNGHDKSASTPEKDTKKFINRSFYLDDTVTEIMLSNMKQDEEDDDIDKETCSVSNSSDYRINLNILSQLIATSDSEPNIDNEHHVGAVHHEKTPKQLFNNRSDSESNQENSAKELVASPSVLNIAPSNTPKIITANKKEDKESKKVKPSIECRKSIEKIYQLMKNFENSKSLDEGIKINGSNIIDEAAGRGSSLIQASDSGTSLKHYLTSSNPSTFSFGKNNNSECQRNYDKPVENLTNVVPKVIISSKNEERKIASEKYKRDERKKTIGSPPKIQENPLKAISQILHEFENVQKNRIKSGREQKPVKKADTTPMNNEGKPPPRCGTFKRQPEPHTDSMNRYNKPPITFKDKNARLLVSGMDAAKNINRQTSVNDRFADKNKKKISDILDEAKEARGEAVRGPSKFTSRLNSLAQPKRIYVQAHSEDYQTRYGRNLITDRLQRLANSPTQPVVNKVTLPANTRNKSKQINNETLPMKFQPGLPIERHPTRSRYQYSTSSSLDRKEMLHRGLNPLNKLGSTAESPEIKKRMVTFEEYVQNQFRPTSFSTIPGEFDYVHKTRTPLLPNDIDIGSVTSSSLSAKESTEVGTRLHHIINSIVKSPSSTLEVLDECFETTTKTVEDHSIPKCYEDISMDSDYITGATDESGLANNGNSVKAEEEHQVNQESGCAICNIRLSQSVRAIEKGEHSQSHLLPVGVFGERHEGISMSRQSSLYFLQSCDVGSIMVKASISQNFKSDSYIDFQIIPSIHKPGLKWSFTNIPMQVTTVGYAFPEYKNLALPVNYGSPSLCNLLEKVSNPSNYTCPLEQAHVRSDTEQYNLHEEPHRKPQNQTPLNEINQIDVTNINETTKEEIDQENEEVKDKSQQIMTENLKKDIDCNTIGTLQQNDEVCVQSPDNIDFSSSLDILVGLLNEIKNMTCQSQLIDNENEESKELQTILNKTFMEHSIQSSPFDELSINALSLTSLEKLRSLESDHSVYSYNLLDNHSIGCYDNIVPDIRPWYDTKNAYYKPIYADKEVSVDLANKECVSTPTDVPSVYFPVKINRSTKVSNSFIGGNRPLSSTQSMISFVDFHSTNSYNRSSTNFDDATNDLIEPKNAKDLNLILVCHKNPKTERKDKIKVIKHKKLNEYNVKNKDNTLCIKSHFDPAMKLKRDILVTIYSVLVLTVFAALSFPEVIYHL